MKFILGTKQNMTEYFTEEGVVVPVTIITAGPVKVTSVKGSEKDGYSAVQVGFGEQKEHRINKPVKGQMKGDLFRVLKEFRLKTGDKFEGAVGDMIDVGAFSAGDKLQVSAISKGKGFQGVVKRHGFHGGPRSHGQKHSEREPGSISGGLRTHVPKGMRMAGRMGSDRITYKNLKVVYVDKENNTMLIKGAVPGKRGTLVEIISRSN
ncbi:MAG: 50S ribosomal protein L3 [Candidatus Nomurabacteria bacterium]|nr:50S ribosomal protein L3 [Candidatus Nomurabacteria bacterium]